MTFVLTGSSPGNIGKIEISSIGSVSLRAPSDPSYDFTGMLIYVDRRAQYEDVKINSIDNFTFNGAIYAPSRRLEINSVDWSAQTDCAQLVAFHLRFNSIDRFGRADQCNAHGTPDVTIGQDGPWLVE